ncbi:MAG: S8 family peptidase, partial [Bdellovibrionales bacterium]|nr:S8 family peptidase [Bdellovibrionales bacterium]
DLSRRLFSEAIEELKLEEQSFPEFIAAERLVVLIYCTLMDAQKIFDLTGAVIEIELATEVTLDWELIEHPEKFLGSKPSFLAPLKDAPSVVVLDTGVNKTHPFLSNAIALAGSVHPDDKDHSDGHGHGTNMVGVALHDEAVSSIARSGGAQKHTHWVESIKLFTGDASRLASRSNAPFWPNMTQQAVELSQEKGRKSERKAFVLAVTANNIEPGSATSWSLSLDELAFNEGKGRLFFVSIGNSDGESYSKIIKNFPHELMLSKLKDPSQSFNSVTVGAFTSKDVLPATDSYRNYSPLAKRGGVSPHTSSGLPFKTGYRVPIKPEIVFEGGNLAVDKTNFSDDRVPTLTTTTTGRDHLNMPFQVMYGTSPAAALAGCLSMQIWNENRNLWPETVRGLMVHSASWTPEMMQLLPSKDDRLALCGYGAPSPELALFCTKDRATVIVQDSLPNLQKIASNTERQMKTFSLPVPKATLLANPDAKVELRVTLSYFAEPNAAKGIPTRGMDLLWDIQGPAEEDDEFLKRINDDMREGDEGSPGTKSFKWEIGIRNRRRGTVQGDRWSGSAADLAGAKLIAVYPKNGWWNFRKDMKFQSTRFSLIISVITPGIDVYNEIKNSIEVETEIEIDL